ncbi:hypothetical protein [Bowmanella denitrificans]|uniref:hypothetical protein n=1 Tax=Bowmanella denitrificans TaxID=366582 RepID=UPI000C9B5D74|nr:hypothetical protein [Bowmanella denitrificans]
MSSRKNINVRNNNPLNIRYNPANNWTGQTGQSGGFATFVSPEYGFRAAAKLIRNYQVNHGLTSIADIVNRWAPEADNNDTQAYINYLADKLNKLTWTPVFESEIPALMLHMSNFEGGKGHFTYEQAEQGAALV